MFSHISVSRRLNADRGPVLERFAADPGDWLPQPAQALGSGQWRIEVWAGPVKRRVIVTIGSPWVLPDASGRTLIWSPVNLTGMPGSHVLPEFLGRVTLRGAEHEPLTLMVEGHYRPPGGAVGQIVDDAMGRHVAEGTVRRLLDGLAVRLQASEATTSASGPT